MTSLDDIHAEDVKRESDATDRVLALLDQLVDALTESPQIWRWGDGHGGYVMAWLDDRLRSAGLELPQAPTRVSVPLNKRRRVLVRDGFRCVACGCDDIDQLTIDHIRPVSRRGMNDLDNLQTLCWPCNQRKGSSF